MRQKNIFKKSEKIKSEKENKILRRKRCPICHKKEDPDGRCQCVNKDAW
jgi:hypothetical protein